METTRLPAASATIILALAAASLAQTYVRQGNVLDANPQVGSGGLNYGSRVYDFNAANRIISGNVTGGQSFRGFSPIASPSSLFISRNAGFVAADGTISTVSGEPFSGVSYGLPSDRLSNFQRDSFGLTWLEQRRANANTPAPYYSPSNTVLNAGAIAAGLNQPGTSQVRSPYADPTSRIRPLPIDPFEAARAQRSGTSLDAGTALMRITTGQPVTGSVNTRLLTSPLFGNVRAVSVSALADEANRDIGGLAQPIGPLERRVEPGQPVDTQARPDALERGAAPPTPFGPEETSWLSPEGAARPGPLPGDLARTADVFQQMRSLAALRKARAAEPGVGLIPGDPRADRAPKDQTEGAPAGASAQPKPVAPGPTTPQLVPRQALQTFVGAEESVVNKYMAEAEVLLKAGDYYRAATKYDFARVVDPYNPLPLLGKSMSLLAAGDYMTSVNNLFAAIDRFEALGKFRIELTSFVPDLDVLDHRRLDLENRLEVFDDFRLRFLLGYAEYCSGLEELGLSNLEKAAQVVPAERESVRTFVRDLRRLTALPTQVAD